MELPVKLAKGLQSFCDRVGLKQPQVIRTLLFNLLTTYTAQSERKTPFARNARRLAWHADRYTGGLRHVDAAVSKKQFRWLCQFSDVSGLNMGDVIYALVRNFIVTMKPGRAEDAFLLTARQLMSRQPSSPQWGNGCERTPDERSAQAYDFMDQHANLSPGKIAAAFRGLGLRHSKQWIEEWRS